MKKEKLLYLGLICLSLFMLWTYLVLNYDVQLYSITNTKIGFYTINIWFQQLLGTHLFLYYLSDWFSLIPIGVCVIFAIIGLIQLIQRKSLLKLDYDIIILGIYYIVVMGCYLYFEMNPINYRPILINQYLEASYPSSTTLLVLTTMPTLYDQIKRRMKSSKFKKVILIFIIIFTLFMVVARLCSGVHWISDIIASIILSIGLFMFYQGLLQTIGETNGIS